MSDLAEGHHPADDGAAGINIRASRYWIANAPAVCGECGDRVTVAALAMMPGHETLELAEAPADDAWVLATGSAFLFFVEYVPEGVRHQLLVFAPSYRLRERCGDGEPSDAVSHWRNHCDRCGSVFDEQALFGEPGGAFVPMTPAEAERIRLVPIDEGFEAAVGGYAYEPECFDSMGQG